MTFTFRGFTHICGRKRWRGGFIVKRKTAGKRLRAKLHEAKEARMRRRHAPIAELGTWLRSVVQGYFNYLGAPGNPDSLDWFRRGRPLCLSTGVAAGGTECRGHGSGRLSVSGFPWPRSCTRIPTSVSTPSTGSRSRMRWQFYVLRGDARKGVPYRGRWTDAGD